MGLDNSSISRRIFGIVTSKEIASVPSFVDLFSKDQYGGPLRDIGYGPNIDEAARFAGQIGTRDISAAANPEGARRVARRLDALYDHRQFVSEALPFRLGFRNTSPARSGRDNIYASYGKPSGRSVSLNFGGSGRVIEPSPEFVIPNLVGLSWRLPWWLLFEKGFHHHHNDTK